MPSWTSREQLLDGFEAAGDMIRVRHRRTDTTTLRGQKPRARRAASVARPGDALARRLARLLVRERRHNQIGAKLRNQIDRALASSPITGYKALAHDVIFALGLDDTADNLERVAAALKQRAAKARRRCRVVTGDHRQGIAGVGGTAHDGAHESQPEHSDMEPILKRRRVVEEEWVVPRDAIEGELGDVEDMNDDDEEPADHDLGAVDEDE